MDPVHKLLQNAKTIAVVGLSDKEHRDSFQVAKYLKEQGYTVIPVNPRATHILGEPCFPSLATIPHSIDIVNIFRGLEAIPGIIDEAIAVKAGSVWMQLGLAHEEAAQKAREAGLQVVMDQCIKVEHDRFFSE